MISFKRGHINKSVILIIVCWYVAYDVSYRHIEEMITKKHIEVIDAIDNQLGFDMYLVRLAEYFLINCLDVTKPKKCPIIK